MSVSVQNLLSVDLFKDAYVAAGINGLNNSIGRINFTDCPFPDDIYTSGLIKKGDLFINSFYIVKEDEDMLYEYIKAYIGCKCSGTFIITEYLDKLPEKIISLCNRHNFPVVFIDHDIPYAEIIKTTMEMILADQSEIISEMKIEQILQNNVSKKLVTDTANEINKYFKTYYASVYIRTQQISSHKNHILFSGLKNLANMETVKYKNGIIIIVNFDKSYYLESCLDDIYGKLNKHLESYNTGISNIFQSIDEFNICIKQSIMACEISNIISSSTVHYKDINLYKILYPLKDSQTLQDFYGEVMTPLINSDSNNDKYELINTIEAYIENDGDYKKTSVLLNQHENTVRYRISKAKRLLNLENSNFKFIEQISIALKIRNILKNK